MTDPFWSLFVNGSGLLHGWEVIVESAVITAVTLLTIISNILVIVTILTTHGLSDVIGFYVVSIAVADLIGGTLIMPLSVYPAMVQRWVYGDLVCKIEAYISIVLWSVNVYTMMWMSVDRYVAVRRPNRYECSSTKMRCKCWISFTWITALFIGCPPLFGYSQAKFYQEAAICILDWGYLGAYTITASILVIGPSVITILYTFAYIFRKIYKYNKAVRENSKEAKSMQPPVSDQPYGNANPIMVFVIITVFCVMWLPTLLLKAYENICGPTNLHLVHFLTLWVAMLGGFWKFVILIMMNPKFRRGLRLLCGRRR